MYTSSTRLWFYLLLAGASYPSTALALSNLEPIAANTPRKTTLTIGISNGSAPQPYSEGTGTRLTLDTELKGVAVRADLSSQRRFDLSGQFAGLQLSKDISPTRYISAGVGAGNSRLYAIWNTNAFLYQKWGVNSPHVTGLGLVYSSMRDGRSERSIVAQQIWYANSQFILEGGIRAGQASPGSVSSSQQFIAATVGQNSTTHAVVRMARSHEAYLLIGADTTLTQFASREGSVALYQPVTKDQTLTLTADRYVNPFYARNRVELGWGLSW